MKVQLRRWVTVGLMSGSLAISALVGTAAVGASSPADSTAMPRESALRELRDYSNVTPEVVAPRVVTIYPASVAAPSVNGGEIPNHDSRT